MLLTQLVPLLIPVRVTVVAPVLASWPDGITNVPLVAPIDNVAVFPDEVFAPLNEYVIVYEPEPMLVELTVTVAVLPWQGDVADGEVKLLTFGLELTTNPAVLLLDTLELQLVVGFAMAVIVTVLEPALPITPVGIVNVPLVAPITNDAVLPVELLTPLRLYVTVNVPVPRLVELTVTTEPEPTQTDVADGEVKFETSGEAFTVTADVVAVSEPHDAVATKV
jgi:hypothetical protein